ncbi:MAG: class I SAM-dependent rRNA methyltransferase [Chloroflexaceae bacterium]
MHAVILRPGRERPVLQRHPWVFSGAIATLQGSPGSGDVVDIYAASGAWLARGTWSSRSQIRVRLFTWDQAETLDVNLLRHRLKRAAFNRTTLPGYTADDDPGETEQATYRLVYAESDGLPGLIVDRYGAYLVVQLLTQGMVAHADCLVELLAEQMRPQGIYERSDAEVREKEGLPPQEGLLWGAEPPAHLVFHGRGATLLPAPRFTVDLRAGQKTGFYLDQAANRQRVANYCAGKDVLDGFCYSGGFTLYAALAGARSITAVDSSAAALALLQEHLQLNQVETPVTPVAGDVFHLLRQYRNEGRQFDVVILDPPKFAHSQAQVDRATRGYKDINLLALQLLRPGGILATFSCSGVISSDLFQKVIFGAALDARRDVQVLERFTQAADHPVLLTFPEGEYLKGLLCRVW